MKYSNCFIEAVKAKLNNWNGVKIIYLNKEINGRRHFLWSENHTVYHYEANSEYDGFLFNGCIKKQSEEVFEAFILRRIAFKNMDAVKFAKRYKFNVLNKAGFLEWETYCPDYGMNNLPKENPFAKLVMIVSNDKMEVQKITECDFGNLPYVNWKYVSPFCKEWKLFSNSAR